MRNKRKLVVLAVLIIAGAFIAIPLLLAERGAAGGEINSGAMGPRPGGGPGGGGETKSVFSVRAARAERRTLQAYIEVNGNIVAEEQIAVVPDVGGRLVSVYAVLGSVVKKGQLIAEVDPARPGETFLVSAVYAPVSGVVISTPAAAGSTVTTTTTLMTIAASTSTRIEARIPEREIGQLKNGLKAAVTLEAFSGETFSAAVTLVSPVVDTQTRTKLIILNFDKPDRRVNPGMFARLRLNTRTYTDVVSVPAQALTEIRGSQGVYVLEGDTARFVEVETGVTVDGETEIRAGLAEGESVVVQGQQFLTSGAKVKVIGAKQ